MLVIFSRDIEDFVNLIFTRYLSVSSARSKDKCASTSCPVSQESSVRKKANAHKAHSLPKLFNRLPENTLEKMEFQEIVEEWLYTLNYISLVVGENLNIIKIIF